MPGQGRVVVFGSINVDLFARVDRHPRPGETVLGSDGSTRPGGKGANQAVAAALAGADVAMFGAVGDDAHAQVGLSLLRRAGVDCAGIRTVPGPTGLALITVSAVGENSIIVIPGANGAVSGADAPHVGEGDVLVVQGEIPVPVVDDAVASAAAVGARPVINLAPIVDLAPATLLAADPLVVNEHEALAAAAIVDPEGATDESEDVRAMASAVAERLIGAGVASVVITLGGEGALVVTPSARTEIPAEAVQVVDTTGAGDCFVGFVAAGLARGASLVDASKEANRASAQAVGAEGAQESYPGWDRFPQAVADARSTGAPAEK